jgi:ABC-type dipeptide/oligopeptide/nickel transport system ATPase component
MPDSARQPSNDPARTEAPLLEVRDLHVSFDVGADERVRAVNGLDVTVHQGQTVALVGESGCGKSVTALTTLGLVPQPPGRVDRGEILFEGRDLLTFSESEMLKVRGGDIAMIFQEPTSSLNPVYSVGDQIIEAIRLHQRVSKRAARKLAVQALREVGIARPEGNLKAYPHEFSGGMCQRAMAAMALACQPKLLLADEPTTALDVTIQKQILQLLADLKRARGMGVLLITHDMGVVASVADVVCVMYAGRVVEYANVFDLFDRPLHPYTRGLFHSIPRVSARAERLRTVRETVSDPGEFRRLSGAQYGVIPWWPDHQAPPDLVSPRDVRGATSAECALMEIDEGHWVNCWRTEYVAGHPSTRPNLDFVRNGAATSAAR